MVTLILIIPILTTTTRLLKTCTISLQNMRKFYEAWKVLDKTTIAIVESRNTGKHIYIQHLMTCQSTCARLFPISRR